MIRTPAPAEIPTTPSISNKGKRYVEEDGKRRKIGMNRVSEDLAKRTPSNKFRVVIGHFAINPPHIEKGIKHEKARIIREVSRMSPKEKAEFFDSDPIDFVEDKKGLKQFFIYCNNCGDVVAYCWAKKANLEGWCDLHHITYNDREMFRGCITPNVSLVDGRLGFECACGEDTRDHRKGSTLPPQARRLMIDYVMAHRDFGKETSSYRAEEANG